MPPKSEAEMAEPENGNVAKYRLEKLEEDFRETAKETERWRRHVDDERVSTREQMKTNTETLRNVVSEVGALKKTLLGLAITIAGSSVIFAISVLASSGRI